MPGVVIKGDDNFESAYRRFKKQVDRNLVVVEYRSKKYFESRSEKKKKEKLNARKKILKKMYMLRRYESRL